MNRLTKVCRSLFTSCNGTNYCYPYSSSSVGTYLNSHIDCFLSSQFSDLKPLLQSHAFIITTGHTNNIFIASKLIYLYASLHQPEFFTEVFDLANPKDTFLWNSIIQAHFSNVDYEKALEFYDRMRLSDVLPNHFTVPMVVSTCAELMLLNYGLKIHGFVSKLNLFDGNSAIGSSFVYLYSKCGCMSNASVLFDEISLKDVVTWTAIVIGYVQNDLSDKGLECLRDMHKTGANAVRLSFRTLEGGFQACGYLGALLEGSCLHGLALKTAILGSHDVQSSILSMYSKCGSPKEAYLSFSEVIGKDLISWTLIIGAYSKFGCATECLAMFKEMQVTGEFPDGTVISCVLSAFGNSMRVSEGKAFHGYIIRKDYELDQMVTNALLSMYCKFGLLEVAERTFHGKYERHKDSWNMMVCAHARMGMEGNCIEKFRKMTYLGIESDVNSLVSVICSCSKFKATRLGRSIHCYVLKSSMLDSVMLASSLIDMYGKFGYLNAGWKIFCSTQKDVIIWNTLIASYCHSGHLVEALALFDEMVLEGIEPNSTTLVTLLSACSRMACLEKGEQVHNYIKCRDLEISLSVATALVDMYAKCGHLDTSREIFNSIKEKDVICWNAMISGYGMHGDAQTAIVIFEQMERSEFLPNEVTFLSVLSACTHAGLVEEAKFLFARMSSYSIKPTLKHYSCMVDLLGRSGNLQEAEALVMSMPMSPDGNLWGSLLSSCRIHNNPEMGVRIARHAISSDPENDGYFIIISDLYSSMGSWEEAEKVRTTMKERGLRKIAGWSTV